MIEILAEISAPQPKPFVAGIVLWDDVVVEAAPILHYMKSGHWTRERVREYCRGKGWDLSVVYELRRGRVLL